jgi:hypothetical protein
MTTATKVATPVPTFPPLTHADRSDAYASGAVQALVRVVKDGKDLLLDGHSFAKHEPALIASGWSVAEDRRELSKNLPTAAY